jgi:glycosyltransferase involved in cell wall biosynthesis
LRILLVSRGVTPTGKGAGGAELAVAQLADNLAQRGEEVVLVSDLQPKWHERMPANVSVVETQTYGGVRRSVKLIPIAFPRWLLQHLLGNVQAARHARKVLESDEKGFDVVHVHGALATILLRRAVRAHAGGIPLVYSEHDSTPWSCRYRSRLERGLRRCVYRWVNLRACRAATVVTAAFPSLVTELAERAGLPRSRFALVGNGIADEWLSRQRDADSVKVVHGLDSYVLFVGSLVARKCPDVLVRALAQVSLPCIFVGDGPMRTSLERLVAKFGIADRVIFTGPVDHRILHCYYAGAEALVLPSVSEAVPLVVLEALGTGVPVVATNLLGFASIVRDRDNGMLVEPGSVASLARALSALETDESLRANLRQGAESSSRAAESWPDVANQLCALYEQHGRAGLLRVEAPALHLPPAAAITEGQAHG